MQVFSIRPLVKVLDDCSSFLQNKKWCWWSFEVKFVHSWVCYYRKSTWQWPRSVFFVTSPTVDVPYFLEATSLTNLMFGAALAQVFWTTGSRDLWYFLHVLTAMETLLRNAKMSSVDCSSVLHSRPLSLCWIFHDAQPLPSLKKDAFYDWSIQQVVHRGSVGGILLCICSRRLMTKGLFFHGFLNGQQMDLPDPWVWIKQSCDKEVKMEPEIKMY